jgi:hypothetical protein
MNPLAMIKAAFASAPRPTPVAEPDPFPTPLARLARLPVDACVRSPTATPVPGQPPKKPKPTCRRAHCNIPDCDGTGHNYNPALDKRLHGEPNPALSGDPFRESDWWDAFF